MNTRGRISRGIHCLSLIGLCAGIGGCANVGPRSISMGRASYNEAINRTEDEQMLLSIVKGRYGETFSLLAVNGVAANVSFGSAANVQAGVGNDDYYMGNLVPFSGGVAYEENPTITYSPVHGDRYLRELFSPVPLDILILLVRNQTFAASPLAILANRVNTIQNPDFLHSPSAQPDPRFARFLELHKELNQAGIMQVVVDLQEEERFNILITGYAPDWADQVLEYHSLLELAAPEGTAEDIIVPLYAGVKGRDPKGIAISPRSTYDLIQIMKAAIDIPKEHLDEGLAMTFPPLGPVGQKVHVHSSKSKPKRAFIAVKHRDYWFYIDDADMQTKLYYQLVRTLWSTSISSAANHKAAPVLTIPVSR
jgi:hypothetical protein